MPSVTIPEMNREVYETVVKSIYADPMKASIREILANAVDANKEVAHARRSSAVRKVIMNVGYDSVKIRDYGFGMSPDTIKDIYGSMYQSTKRSPYKDAVTEANGEHGIGSKAPYGYLYSIENDGISAQFYTVTTINAGTKYQYIMFLNEHGIPSYELYHEESTLEESGTEVTLPFTYIEHCNTDNITKLILVMLPFYMKDFGSLVELTGENQGIIDIIDAAVKSTYRIGRLYMCDMSKYGLGLNNDSVLVKYKNILYPSSQFNEQLSFSRKNTSRLAVFYDIDLDSLSGPLETNRSRDRIEWNNTTARDTINTDIQNEIDILFSRTQVFFETLIANSTLMSTIRHNNVIETVRSLAYSGVNTRQVLESKKLLRKKFITNVLDNNSLRAGEKELAIWQELFRVPDSVIANILVTSGIPSMELLYVILENFQTYKYFNIDSIEEKTSESREILNFYIGSTLKEVYMIEDTPTFRSTNSYILKNSINAILNNSEISFIVRDSKSFKNECHAFLTDSERNGDYDTVYMIDSLSSSQYTADYIAEAFRREGVVNVYLTSELSVEYKDKIIEIKALAKKDKCATIKRIKGIRYLGYNRSVTQMTVSDKARKTVNSDVVVDVAEKVDSIAVLKVSDYMVNVSNQDNDIIWGTYTFDTLGTYNVYESNATLKLTNHNGVSSMVSNEGLLGFLDDHEALVVVEDEHYDIVMGYFDDVEVTDFSDRVKSVLSGFVSHVYATPTLGDLTNMVSELNEEYPEIYTNAERSIVNNYIDMSTDLYDFMDFNNPMHEYSQKYKGSVYCAFRDFVKYHRSEELKGVAIDMYNEIKKSQLARTMIHGINRYSMSRSRDAYLEFFEHINTIIDMKFFIEKYLTDKK